MVSKEDADLMINYHIPDEEMNKLVKDTNIVKVFRSCEKFIDEMTIYWKQIMKKYPEDKAGATFMTTLTSCHHTIVSVYPKKHQKIIFDKVLLFEDLVKERADHIRDVKRKDKDGND